MIAGGVIGRLREAGLLPRKPLGQHFLHDPKLLRALVAEAGIGPGDSVLEVGVGPGTLTSQLAATAGTVLGVEIDDRMLRFAATELKDYGNVRLLAADALGRDGELGAEVAAAARALGPFLWVSNLPYNIASRLVVTVLASGLPLRGASLLVQAEVAGRMAAAPGSPAYGPLSLLVSYWARARLGRKVPPGAFWPPPKVDSRIVHLEPREPLGDPALFPAYSAWVTGLFQGRRKQLGTLLRRNLKAGPAIEALKRMGIDPRQRPEQLEPAVIVRLAMELSPFSR